jgi:SAM-dependent methyltransferase
VSATTWTRDRLQSRPVLYGAARRGWEWAADRLPPREVASVGPVHRGDLMLRSRKPDAAGYYLRTGQQAADFVAACVDLGTARVLDFGCGHGRVTRHLARRMTPGHLDVCDLDPGAVRFCATRFDARPVAGSTDLDQLDLATYDAIWMGSVLTHLDAPTSQRLLERLVGSLATGGALVFSTHGAYAESHLDAFGADPAQHATEIRACLDRDGFAYRAYPHQPDAGYGLAWHRPAAVRVLVRSLGLQVVDYAPNGWGERQDVWTTRRPASTAGRA